MKSSNPILDTESAKEEGHDTAPPKLDSGFFIKLVNKPPCTTKGECNGCGRCEH